MIYAQDQTVRLGRPEFVAQEHPAERPLTQRHVTLIDRPKMTKPK